MKYNKFKIFKKVFDENLSYEENSVELDKAGCKISKSTYYRYKRWVSGPIRKRKLDQSILIRYYNSSRTTKENLERLKKVTGCEISVATYNEMMNSNNLEFLEKSKSSLIRQFKDYYASDKTKYKRIYDFGTILMLLEIENPEWEGEMLDLIAKLVKTCLDNTSKGKSIVEITNNALNACCKVLID